MELHNIELLIHKYLEGETSLQEEKQLRAYFSSGNVAPRFKEYEVLFGFFEAEAARTYMASRPIRNTKKPYAWLAVAASIAIIVGVFLFRPAPQEASGVIKDPEVALRKTKEVLHLIAQQMHQGKEGLVYLTEIDRTRDELIDENLKLTK